MENLIGLLGIALILGLSVLLSNNRRHINWRLVVTGIVIQVIFAFLILKVPFVNGMGYSNPEVDALFDTEFKEADTAKRTAMWRDIQKILMHDLPALPLFELPAIHAASAKFKDVVTGPQGYIESRENAYEVR